MKFQDLGLLLVRLLSGGMMLTHGIPKIDRLMGEGPVKFADPFGLGPEISLVLVLFAEVACSILVMIGLKTRLATLPLMFTMLVAAFTSMAQILLEKKNFPCSSSLFLDPF